jgi:hypothetical protein
MSSCKNLQNVICICISYAVTIKKGYSLNAACQNSNKVLHIQQTDSACVTLPNALVNGIDNPQKNVDLRTHTPHLYFVDKFEDFISLITLRKYNQYTLCSYTMKPDVSVCDITYQPKL